MLENQRRLYNLVGNTRNSDILKGLYDKQTHINTKYLVSLKEKSGENCFHCNVQLDWCNTVHVRRNNQPTLQRMLNTRGHTQDNVVWACFECNVKKRAENREMLLQRFERDKTYTYEDIRNVLLQN
jgi:RNase P subunit RPR2